MFHIHTNILRLQIEGSCDQYEIICHEDIEEEDILELQRYIE